MIILAIDLGHFNAMCCFFDTETQEYSFWPAATTRRYLRTVLEKNDVDVVVMEACGPSGWTHDLSREMGKETVVCSTNEEAWRWKNVKRKTHKDDALKLAQLSMLGQLKPVHVPAPAAREHRSLTKYRKTLDQHIGRAKNSIRSLFANHGIEIPRGSKAWFSGRGEFNACRTAFFDCRAPLDRITGSTRSQSCRSCYPVRYMSVALRRRGGAIWAWCLGRTNRACRQRPRPLGPTRHNRHATELNSV